MAKAWIAAFAATALLLQAVLLSLTPRADAAIAIQDLSGAALCLGSRTRPEDPAAPAPPHDHHADHACCILCAVPGLAAGTGSIAFVALLWIRSSLVDAPHGLVIHLARPFERSPVRPRAPPA